jgi:hypothetical protein
MTTGIKSTNKRLDWKTADLYNRSLPEGVNKDDVSLVTGSIKVEVHYII